MKTINELLNDFGSKRLVKFKNKKHKQNTVSMAIWLATFLSLTISDKR